jgi:hypothetical protein
MMLKTVIVACAALGLTVCLALIWIAQHDNRAELKSCLARGGAWSKGECHER